MTIAATRTNSRRFSKWLGRLCNGPKRAFFAALLMLGLLVNVSSQPIIAFAQEASQSKGEAKVPPAADKQKSAPAADVKSPSAAKPTPKPQETKPKTDGAEVPPSPAVDNAVNNNAANANVNVNANAANNAAQATPPNFGRLDAGQGQLVARTSIPGFFGDFFAPGGNVLNVPGTPLHTPTAGAIGPLPLALGFAADTTKNSLTPAQLYFRSVTTTPVLQFPFQKAPGNEGYVYRTNTPGINFATPATNSTFQLNTIPPQSKNAVGYFVPITATAVNSGAGFSGQLSELQKAPPSTINGQPLSDVIAVGAPITKFGTTQAAVNRVYGLMSDTQDKNANAQPLVFHGGPGSNLQIPILFVLTSNTSTSVYSPSAAAGGTQKLVDNASPLPRDRVFFNYSYFENTAIVVNGHEVDVNRITPGFEKTFLNQQMSVEVRVPFATTIDNVNLTGTTNTGNIMLGNQTTYLKALLYSDSNIAFSSGLGIQLPTAASTDYAVNGYSIAAATGQYTQLGPLDVLKIRNEAVHLMPFLGSVYTPNDRFYTQSVAQLDFATNGNSVYNAAVYPVLNSTDNDPNKWTVTSATTGLSKAGSLNDTNFMYLSASAGYWMYKVKNQYEKGITGFAPTAELHYNQSLTRGDTVSGFYGNSGNGVGNISQVNGVLGANTVIGFDKYLSVAYVAPFGTGVNRAFDGELRVMFNYYFGASRVNPRFSNVPGQ